jgi:hypothetical protein
MRNYGREQYKNLLNNKWKKENGVELDKHYVKQQEQYKDTHGRDPLWYKEKA